MTYVLMPLRTLQQIHTEMVRLNATPALLARIQTSMEMMRAMHYDDLDETIVRAVDFDINTRYELMTDERIRAKARDLLGQRSTAALEKRLILFRLHALLKPPKRLAYDRGVDGVKRYKLWICK